MKEITIKDMVESIFGKEAAEDKDIVNLYEAVVKDVLDSYRIEKRLPVDTVVDLPDCTRVEVIDKNGRAYHSYSPQSRVQLSMQDDYQTLKVFIS
jgi:hypothetical protein